MLIFTELNCHGTYLTLLRVIPFYIRTSTPQRQNILNEITAKLKGENTKNKGLVTFRVRRQILKSKPVE